MKIAAWITLTLGIIASIMLLIGVLVYGPNWSMVIKGVIIIPIFVIWAIRTLRREKQKEKELQAGHINPDNTDNGQF